jgi:hypothetical protein
LFSKNRPICEELASLVVNLGGSQGVSAATRLGARIIFSFRSLLNFNFFRNVEVKTTAVV